MDNQQEAALRARLVEQIVNPQVVAPMEAAGWNQNNYTNSTFAGQPGAGGVAPLPNAALPPNQYSQDYPATGVPAGVQAQHSSLDFEQFKDPSTGLYAGKYTSPEELVKGMRNVVDMAKQAFAERDELKYKLASMPTTVAQREQPTLPPSAYNGPEILDRVLNQIVEEGGILDGDNSKMLRDALISVADERVRDVVSAKSRQEQVWDSVSSKMENRYPGSSNRADELQLYIEANPALLQAVGNLISSGKEFEATEMAWRLMTNANLGTSSALTPAQVQEETMQAQNAVRQEAVDAARKDAGVFTTTGSGVHEMPPQYASHDEVMDAAAYGHKTADWSQWRRAALGKYVDFDSPLFGG